MILLRLFFEFFKIGLFSIGGGMATIPFLYDLSEKTGWFTANNLADMIAVSESTPGSIGVNMSTYVGFTTGGIPGAVIATLGLVTPSIIVILIIARFLSSFRQNQYVDGAFRIIRPVSTALIAAAGFLVLKLSLLNIAAFKAEGTIASLVNYKSVILAVVIFAASNYIKPLKKLHPVVFIVISAVVGAVFGFAE